MFRARKACASSKQPDGHVALEQFFVFLLAEFVDPRRLLRQHLPAVNDGLYGRKTAERVTTLLLGQLRATNHDFGRHAADVDAGTADRVAALDQGHGCTLLCRAYRGGKSRGTGTDDGDIETVFAATSRTRCAVGRGTLIALVLERP